MISHHGTSFHFPDWFELLCVVGAAMIGIWLVLWRAPIHEPKAVELNRWSNLSLQADSSPSGDKFHQGGVISVLNYCIGGMDGGDSWVTMENRSGLNTQPSSALNNLWAWITNYHKLLISDSNNLKFYFRCHVWGRKVFSFFRYLWSAVNLFERVTDIVNLVS